MLAEVPLDLLLVVFTEVHRASHLLWHTIDPTHPAHLREGAGASSAVTGGLLDIYREVDQQVGRLLEAVGSDTTVLVFSLHGMRAHEGIPTILDPLLRSLGLASVKGWEALSWPERARQVFRAVKQRIPPSLKRLYYRLVSRSVMVRIAQSTLMPAYDWSRTIAFPLPTDQHGWIRLNLIGREAQGILDPGEYQAVCSNLEGVLRGLRATDGSRVVRDVLRIARETGGAPPQHLPDLIIHWDDAASASPLRLRTPTISARPIGRKFTGQHAPEGYFILRPGPGAGGVMNPGGSIAAEDLHQLLLGALEGG
jgi:predicted AlkP superfamily phosphohydrolase/phosphomutase